MATSVKQLKDKSGTSFNPNIITDEITASKSSVSGVSITNLQVKKSNNVCHVKIDFSCSNTYNDKTIATGLPYRAEEMGCNLIDSNGEYKGRIYIGTSGQLKLTNCRSFGSIYAYFVYVTGSA